MSQQQIFEDKYPEKYTQLCAAIQEADKETARQLILNNAVVNPGFESYKITPLHWAIIKFEDSEIAELLIDRDADLYAVDEDIKTALDVAIDMNKINVIELVLKKRILSNGLLNLSICRTIKNRNEEIFKIFIEHTVTKGIPIDFISLLNYVLEKKWLRIVSYIIPHCKIENARTKIVSEYIVYEKYQEARDFVDALFNYGFTIRPRNINDPIFVCAAVENGYTMIVKELLKLGTNVNMIDEMSKLSLLHFACLHRHLKIAELLIEYKVDINSTIGPSLITFTSEEWNLSGKNALCIAVMNLDMQMIRLLLNNGAVIGNLCESPGKAIEKGYKEIIEILLNYGTNVEHTDATGNTLLLYCSKYKKFNIAELLLKRNANVNAQNQDGKTPLFFAVENVYGEMAKMFLEHNADINCRDIYGKTVLHVACEYSAN